MQADARAHFPTSRFPVVRAMVVSPGFCSTILFRIQHFFWRKKLLLFSYMLRHINLVVYGIDILPGARIESGLRIDHPSGIVIGANVRIGKNCTIMSGVVLGAAVTNRGQTIVGRFHNPTIGSNVLIGTKATILGPVEIADNSLIKAHTLIY